MIHPSRCCGTWNAIVMFSKGMLDILIGPVIFATICHNLNMDDLARFFGRFDINLRK